MDVPFTLFGFAGEGSVTPPKLFIFYCGTQCMKPVLLEKKAIALIFVLMSKKYLNS
jgi:hypothetical protein